MKRVLLLACSVAAEMRPRSRSLRARPLAPRPAVEVDEFEQRRRLACVNVDTTQDSYGDTCSTYYDHNPGGCGTGDDKDFKAKDLCCACGGGEGTWAPTITPQPSTAVPTPYYDGEFHTSASLRMAVAAWFEDRAAAEEKYGEISSWKTERVTDMSQLFCIRQWWMDDPNEAEHGNMDNCVLPAEANTFNEDISDWDTSAVTSFYLMFYKQKAFNQPIGGSWRVGAATNMEWMFQSASAFNQPLGDWEVDNVLRMNHMFYKAEAFNQDISGWNVEQVTNMNNMFRGAKAFDQDLGWVVCDGVNLELAFWNTQCGPGDSDRESEEQCGISTVDCAPTPAPSVEVRPRGSKKKKSQKLSTGEIVAIIVAAILAFLLCLLGCLLFKRGRKDSERKDSWDISTMFTNTSASWADEAPPADASPQQSQEPATPQELNKITEAAEL